MADRLPGSALRFSLDGVLVSLTQIALCTKGLEVVEDGLAPLGLGDNVDHFPLQLRMGPPASVAPFTVLVVPLKGSDVEVS